jgi:enterochelin esterase-like enzyme
MRLSPRIFAGLVVAAAMSCPFPAELHAQPASNATGAQQVVSPEVAPDRRVTLRLFAPNAKAVTLNGDFFTSGPTSAPMTKNEQGVWSITLPPQDQGIFGYYFRVDGVRMVDPSNLLISSSAEFLKSYVEIPGDTPAFWALRDVPHGQLHEVWYKNPALGVRRVLVYTPPGFDPAATRTYPSAYLLHSTTDNETFWSRIGRANFIVDNLLADGRAKPLLLVMVFGHTSVPRGPEEGAGGKDLYDVAVIGQDIVDCVIPAMEKQFHASPAGKDRAIFGMAMGGYQAITIGMNHPGVFGYVTAASANFRAGMDLATNFQGLNANLEAAKHSIKYIAMMTGGGEAGNIPQSKRVTDYFGTLGLKADWSVPEGGKHLWQTWRGYFRDLVERKFFVDDAYATPPVKAP